MAAARIPPSSGHASMHRQSRRIVSPSRDAMIRVVAALVKSDGTMPTIAQVRQALGDATRADQWVVNEFGRYDLLFKAVRVYLQTNRQPAVQRAPSSANPTTPPAPVPSPQVGRQSKVPSQIPPPLLIPMLCSVLSRRHAHQSPAVLTLKDIVARVNRVGIAVEDPVELLFLSVLWNTKDRPNPIPMWGDWRGFVGFAAGKLVGQFQNLQLMSNGGKVEEKKFAMIVYERQEVNGDWQLTTIELHQADRLEDLPHTDLSHGEGRIWFMRREKSAYYDWLALGGEGVEELPVPIEDPHARWQPGMVVVAPDAAAIDRARQQLAKLLKDRSFEGIAESRMPPLVTPAELKSVKPIENVPVEIENQTPGFAPSAVEWKDLALRPTDTRYVGKLPELSKFEALLIWAAALLMGVRLMRSAPMESPGSGSLFFNSSGRRDPEGT